jgi:hypothetical protein
LNREEDQLQIGAYQVEEVHVKPRKVRTCEQSTRRPDAGILDEPLLQMLKNPFIFCIVVPSNRKRKQQNWDEFNVRFMVGVKNPSQVGANWRVIS